jgi:3-hydroxybutyryl-CoA dehydrogenase
MHLVVISSQPVSHLFGKEFPFADFQCIIREELLPEDLHTADCIIDLTIEDEPDRIINYQSTTIPVLIGSVVFTLKELAIDLQLPIARFNHWPTFISRNCIEFAVADSYVEKFQQLFQALAIPLFKTADEPGFVSARTVSMIVNEAFLAKEEAVSTEPEIDTAMKLGTSYPMGPFEWCSKIGAHRITRLLQKLAEKDKRYQPALSFTQTIQS